MICGGILLRSITPPRYMVYDRILSLIGLCLNKLTFTIDFIKETYRSRCTGGGGLGRERQADRGIRLERPA